VVVAVGAALTVGGIYGVAVSTHNYVIALRNNIKPEGTAGRPATALGDEPAIQSYFFGKGYRDLKATISDCYGANARFSDETWQSASAADLGVMKAVQFGAALSCLLYGTAFFGVLSVIHAIILGAVLALIFLLFSAVLTVEKIYLAFHGFFTVCPACHEKAPLPVYRCDSCGEKHRRLIPSSYGIFHHRCLCGQSLPATFFLNRGRLPASCPACDHSLLRAHTEARKLFVPIIGGPSTGKTAYLVWLVEALRREAAAVGQNFEFLEALHDTEQQARLNALRAGRMPAKTVETTPKAVNLNFIQTGQSHRNLYLYDPAGEAFGDGSLLIPLRFLSYCSGVLFLIDPFSIPAVSAKYGLTPHSANDIKPSLQQPGELMDRLLFVLEKHFSLDPAASIPVPIAVVLTKVDAFDLESVIGDKGLPASLKEGELEAARAARISRQLRDWGIVPLVEVIERRFATHCFFSCSSVGAGHKAGRGFSPLRVDEPFHWLMRKAGTGLLVPDTASDVAPKSVLDATGGASSRWTSRSKTVTTILALIAAGSILAGKLHLNDEAVYSTARGDTQKLSAYLSACTICWHGADARQEIASAASALVAAIDTDDEAYRKARGNADRLHDYASSCRTCRHKAEALEGIRRLEQTATVNEEPTYQSAKGNVDNLQRYLNGCQICAHRADATGEIAALQKQQRVAAEAAAYQSARGSPEKLRFYVNACKECLWKSTALSEIQNLEIQANYFGFEVCNPSRYLASVAVIGRKVPASNQRTALGWWTVASGACAKVGRFVKGNIDVVASVTGGLRGWFGSDARQCIPSSQQFEIPAGPDNGCAGGRILGFRSLQVTENEYKFQLAGEPDWSVDTFFTFQVCNRRSRWAAVAIMGRETPDDNQWIVRGWWRIAPDQCGDIGRYVRGPFFMAEQVGATAQWSDNDIMLCVDHRGDFRRINSPTYRCRVNDMIPFKRFQITQATETWDLTNGY
jgi:uncharacterized membrane protein